MDNSKSKNQFIKYGVLLIAFLALVPVIWVFVTDSGEKEAAGPIMPPDQLIENLRTGEFTGFLRDYHLKDYDVRNFLLQTSKETGLNFIVRPGVAGKINCDMDDVPWDKALHLFLEELGLEIRSTGSILVVQKKEEVPDGPVKRALSPEQLMKNFTSKKFTGRRRDFDLKNRNLVNLIQNFAKDYDLSIIVKPGITGNITCKLDDIPWDEALHFILDQNGLELNNDRGTLIVQRKGAAVQKRKKPVMSPQQLMKNFKTQEFTGDPRSYHLKNQDMVDLLMHFSRDTGLNIFVKSGVQGLVTCELVDIPWDRALHLFLEQNNLEIKLDGSVLIVREKKRYPPV